MSREQEVGFTSEGTVTNPPQWRVREGHSHDYPFIDVGKPLIDADALS